MASTKAAVVAAGTGHGLRFVGGHPMAGRETSGYGAAAADLFVDRPWVVVPTDPDDLPAVVAVETLAVASRARPIRMDAATHDWPLPRSATCPWSSRRRSSRPSPGRTRAGPRRRAGRWPGRSPPRGWRDMTRLARGDVAMGAGIAATNAPAIATRLRELRDVLDGWLADLERSGGPDEAALARRLAAAREQLGDAGVTTSASSSSPGRRSRTVPGGTASGPTDLDAFVEALERDGRYEPRPQMEVDPSFKQVIPYLVLRDGERYFLMRRTRAGVDARLHDRYSIGVGGHLNPGDGGVLGGLRREWREELVADFEPAFRLVGLLNDDTTEVGAVHLGAVYVAEAAGRPVTIRETDKLTGSFVEPARGGRGRRRAGDLEPPLFRVPRSSRSTMTAPEVTVFRRIDHIGRFLFAVPLVLGTVLMLAGSPARAADDAPRVAVLPTSGVVDAIMAGYLEDGIAKAHRDGADAVVIKLNTPGGASTRRVAS